MQYKRFGKTDLTVSEVGFGCARLGGIFQGATQAEMVRMLHQALDQGITFYDTSDMYCQGESEALLGEAFRGRRDRVVIASKVGYCLPTQRRVAARIKPLLRPLIQRVGLKRRHLPSSVRGTLSQNFSSRYIVSAAEQSLKRLRTDYLDLYQLHSPPASVLENGDWLSALETLKSQGKIRHFGVSCETTEDALICLPFPQVSSLQIRLNLLDQSALNEVVPRAAAQGMGIIARECFAGGLLTRPIDALNMEEMVSDDVERAARRRQITNYQRIADDNSRPLTEVALQFLLGLDGISVTLLGMRTGAHLMSNLGHLAAPRLSGEEMRALLRQPLVDKA